MCRREQYACNQRKAKWFSPEPLPFCPRCGSTDVLTTEAVPPWRHQPQGTTAHQDENAKSRAEGGEQR